MAASRRSPKPGSSSEYVELVKKAADQAVRDRFLLREDADRLIAQASAAGWWF
jgi:hypothetical protein